VNGRAYVVGGGSRGLGRAVAAELVSRGARVVLVSRSAEALDAAAAELGEFAIPCPADLSADDGADAVARVGMASGLSIGMAIGLGGIAALSLGAVADAVDLQAAVLATALGPLLALGVALVLPAAPRIASGTAPAEAGVIAP